MLIERILHTFHFSVSQFMTVKHKLQSKTQTSNSTTRSRFLFSSFNNYTSFEHITFSASLYGTFDMFIICRLAAIDRNGGGLVEERLDGVRTTRWAVVSELDARMRVSPFSAAIMEAADGSRQARLPPIALGHGLRYRIDAFRVGERLIIENLAGFSYAKNSNLSTCSEGRASESVFTHKH